MRLAQTPIYRRNIKMNGFVVVSSNMGVVRTEEDYIMVAVSPQIVCCKPSGRYKIAFRTSCRDVLDLRLSTAEDIRAGVMRKNLRSAICLLESYRDLFGSELRLEAIHAGLECGLFQKQFRDWMRSPVGGNTE